MTGEIISIGDELLIGQVVNTNASFMANRLNAAGVEVKNVVTVGDDAAAIRDAFGRAFRRADVICVTGGLGPTHDDITKAVASEFFESRLVRNKTALAGLKEYLKSRNLELTPSREGQAFVPEGCTVIPNRRGTAPGMLLERGGKYFIIMPGVPVEMKGMMDDFVVPFISSRNQGQVILHRTLLTTGLPESDLADRIGDVKEFLPKDGATTLAFLPSALGVRLRISVRGKDLESAKSEVARVESILKERGGDYMYGDEEGTMEEIVGHLLKERNITISVAESCTGGLIAHRITNVPGSSGWFERGVVTYSNESKTALLGVPREVIEAHGAVSRETAGAMARGIRAAAGTSIGISTTGIAGPTGATPMKPVGLVWIGYADEKAAEAYEYRFGGERHIVKERSAQAALDLVRRKLLGLPILRRP